MDEEMLLSFWFDTEVGYLEEKINSISNNEIEMEIEICDEFKNAVEKIKWDDFYMNKEKHKKMNGSPVKKKFSFYVEDTSDEEVSEHNYERKVKKNINYYINNLEHIENSAINIEREDTQESVEIDKIIENTKTLKEKLQNLEDILFIKK